MQNDSFPVFLGHRIDPARNMARFYLIAIETNLFGETCLRRTWGRIGTRGRIAEEIFADAASAEQAMAALARRKQQRGYRVAGQGL
ncbi:WGR domain-containing protein [Rhizobium straminoryzae]|uniref:WGR domain-containing protein n=1 Tax=Rhizobium straminoryzae TaxID=1387186 RepID=A0A549TCR5_9HYPH|nr:WGR domain-containing protein [Rhizobium straminoryzae]TRL39697.1 WGR domain-containing protein [Rhizobium straminoryzae]